MVRKQGILQEYGSSLALASRLFDVLLIAAMSWVGYTIRFGPPGWLMPADYTAATLVGVLLGTLTLHGFGVYRSWRGTALVSLAQRAVTAWLLAFALLIVILVAVHAGEHYSRLWLGYWFTGTVIGLVLVRVCIHQLLRWLRRRGWNRKNVVIFGAGELGREAAQVVHEESWTGFHVVAFFDDDPEREGEHLEGVPVHADVERLPQALADYGAHEVWLALPLRCEERVRELMHQLRHSPVNIRLVPDLFGMRLLNFSVTDIAGMTVLNLSATPMAGLNRLVKAIEDRVGSALLLVLLSPVMLGVVMGIYFTMGRPVLFSQQRIGWDGRPFTVYKFRTMKPHVPEEEDWVEQARPDDPRITPFGRFLRRTSLDELPQLFNVFAGSMSLVGPRPHALEHDEYYKQEIEHYMKRHRVKPGMTGWAQVHGLRGETRELDDMQRRVEYDLFYIENWSLMRDVQILAMTLVHLVRGDAAY